MDDVGEIVSGFSLIEYKPAYLGIKNFFFYLLTCNKHLYYLTSFTNLSLINQSTFY